MRTVCTGPLLDEAAVRVGSAGFVWFVIYGLAATAHLRVRPLTSQLR